MTSDQVLTLVIAGLSLLVAFAGTWLSFGRAKESDRTAREALVDARLARREAVELALWTGAIEAVMRMIGFDPAREPVGARLQDLRVRFTLLVDQLDSWDGFDEWLAEEHALGVAFGREVMEQARPTDTVEERVEKMGQYAAWAVALSSNLRFLRRRGYRPSKLRFLRDHAREVRASLYQRNSWGEMPTRVPGIEVLPDDEGV